VIRIRDIIDVTIQITAAGVMGVTPAGGVMDVMVVTAVAGATDVMGATGAKVTDGARVADVIRCRPLTAKDHVRVNLARAVTVARLMARPGKA
jgi:hypothetical protein